MRKEESVQALGAVERRLDQANAELKYVVPVTHYANLGKRFLCL